MRPLLVWSSPNYLETMTLKQVHALLKEAKKLGTVEWVWFEGGEPFLYYPIMVKGVKQAKNLGFKVGVLSNAYWATCPEDASEWLRPLAELKGCTSTRWDTYTCVKGFP